MRRFLALIAIPLLACVVLAGCGSSKSSLIIVILFFVFVFVFILELGRHGDRVVRQGADSGHPEGHGATVSRSRRSSKARRHADRCDAMAANFVLYFWDGTTPR